MPLWYKNKINQRMKAMRFFSFDTQAQTYHHSAIAQRIFIKKLLSRLDRTHYTLIAELGCGGGEVFEELAKNQVSFEQFLACDISQSMLKTFPAHSKVKLFCQDFDDFLLRSEVSFDLLLSSSALQWSHSLKKTLSLIAQKTHFVALSIMSASSLKSLHSFLNTTSPLPTSQEIEEFLQECFDGELYRSRVELEFSTPKESLAHLKKSGVLGGGILDFKRAKKMLNFDGKIEYESINIIGKPKKEHR